MQWASDKLKRNKAWKPKLWFFIYFFLIFLLKSDCNSFGIQAHYFYIRISINAETEVENLPSATTDRRLWKSSTYLRVWCRLSCNTSHEGCADDYCWRKDIEWKRTVVFLVLLEIAQVSSWAEKLINTYSRPQKRLQAWKLCSCSTERQTEAYLPAVYAHIKSLAQCYTSVGAAGVCAL